jgi:hypothetical protein
LVHNRDQNRRLDFEFVVCCAVQTLPDGTIKELPTGDVHPFTIKERRGMAGAGTAAIYTVRKDIVESGAVIAIRGAFFPTPPCEEHDPCAGGRGFRVHTDWHIEC